MNLLIEFQNFDPEDKNDRWQSFCRIFPLIVNDDSNLKALIAENAVHEYWEEIKENYLIVLTSDLMYIAFTKSDEIQSEDDLFDNILAVCQDMISRAVLSVLSPEIEFSDGRKGQGVQKSLETMLKQFSAVEKKAKDFSLETPRLRHILKNWNSNLSYSDEYKGVLPIRTVPVIKVLDTFDPAFYKLIQQNPALLRTMDWRVFEEMIADLLKTFGFEVELTKMTNDGGIDVIAFKKDDILGSHKYILQAKRSINKIEVSPIRELLYLHQQHNASKSIFATTSTFTRGAVKEAKKFQWTLELKDKDEILKWIDRATKMKSKK